jgi:hypothetical protein
MIAMPMQPNMCANIGSPAAGLKTRRRGQIGSSHEENDFFISSYSQN